MPTTKEQLQETLRSLESYKLPQSLEDALSSSDPHQQHQQSSSSLDPALIERYKQARDLYLLRHIQRSFLEAVGTYDCDGDDDCNDFFCKPEIPTEEDEDALHEKLNQVRTRFTEGAQSAHQQLLELKYKHETFCLRREELHKMVDDMKSHEEEDAMDIDGNNDNEEEEEDVEDEALAAEEERLAALQLKKAQLEAQLHKIRQETSQLTLQTEHITKEVEDVLHQQQPLPESPTALQEEAAQTQLQLQKVTDMKDLYDNLREAMEELSGIKILSVRHYGTTTTTSEEDNTDSPQNEDTQEDGEEGEERQAPGIEIHVRLLDEHEILVTLQSNPKQPGALRVVNAKFLTSVLIKGETNNDECNTTSQEEEQKRNGIEMEIPPLTNLVKLCACFPPAEELRFLLRETMARIRMIEARVEDLNYLDQEYLTQIGSYYKCTEENFGGEEQEVVCSLRECITVVLRLTADFPCIPGSVYISQMVGVGGWNEEDVETIKERVVAKQEYSSAHALMKQVQQEIARLQDEENLSLPKTPQLPLRRKRN